MTARARTHRWAFSAAGTMMAGLGYVLVTLPAAAATPVVVMAPSSPYSDGQQISVSVGPNSLFVPHSRIVILECADPGGSPANLPTSDSSCDGNTIQGNSIIVNSDGSFSEPDYVVYQLPNLTTLGEVASGQPVCNASAACALFVGQDQNDFTQPKVFSAAFSVGTSAPFNSSATASPATPTAGPAGNGPSTSATSNTSPSSPNPTSTSSANAAKPTSVHESGSSASASVASGSSGTLAFTGPPALLGPFSIASVLAMGIGSGLLLTARRRRRKTQVPS
jgi:hypothetical protein